MPKRIFTEYRNYSVEVLLVSDVHIPEITGQPEKVIALTPSIVQIGATRAKRYMALGRLEDDDMEMPTYQELNAKNERLVKKYSAEMDTLNKSQFKIRMLEEIIEESRERRSIERRKTRGNIQKLQNLIEELEKTQLEVVAELNAQLDALKSRNWWQRLFG